MTSEEAINRLEDTFEAWERWNPHNDSPSSKLSEALGMAISALREQDATDRNVGHKWISVEECLPETEMHGTSRVVLAWESEHGRCFAMVYENGQGKRWFSGGVEIPNITHWMPLPEPPKEDA